MKDRVEPHKPTSIADNDVDGHPVGRFQPVFRDCDESVATLLNAPVFAAARLARGVAGTAGNRSLEVIGTRFAEEQIRTIGHFEANTTPDRPRGVLDADTGLVRVRRQPIRERTI